ncbi:MAG: FecR domain-containing protein [Ferruginibacter sp.]
MDTDEHITIIVAKKLRGEATLQELQELQCWLDAAIANRQEYNKMELLWAEARNIFSETDFDTNAAWNKVNAAIENAGPEKAAKNAPLIAIYSVLAKRITVAAASVLLLIGGLYFYTGNTAPRKMIAAAKENLVVILPDNSNVFLRKGSSISFPVNFDKDMRSVELSGEAYFEVRRNELQPFIISTANSNVKVLGTSFLVRSKEDRDEIVVVTGKVNVADKEKEANQVMLAAGQKAVFLNKVFHQSLVKDSNFISWKNGLLIFKNNSLAKVLDDLSNYYDIPVNISPVNKAEIEKIQINMRVEKQSFEQVVEEIKLITGLAVKKERGNTIFYKK